MTPDLLAYAQHCCNVDVEVCAFGIVLALPDDKFNRENFDAILNYHGYKADDALYNEMADHAARLAARFPSI